MRAWKPREQVLAGVTAAVLLGALLVEVMFLPQWSRYTRKRDEVARLQVALTRMRANILLKDQIEARYEQFKGLIHESGSASQEMSRFARLLTELYGPLGLQTRSVRPLPDEDEGFYRKFALSLEMEGPVLEIGRFLAAAARAADPIRIERIELSCKDRPDLVTAQVVVTKVTTTSRPAGEASRQPRPRTTLVRASQGGMP
jgi:Tfp pilus assembly protein PilO